THDLGIYLNVETIKPAFLVRNFGSSAGNLYEAMLSDFRPGWVSTYQRKTNEGNNDGLDVVALTRVLETASDADLLDQLSVHVDVDEFLTFWAMEALVGHWDGYSGDRNNYYVYKNPADGLFHFMTWGNDDTFGQGNPLLGEGTLASLLWARGILARRLYLMPGGAESYTQRLEQLFDSVWDETAILAEIDRMEALLWPVTGDLSAFIDPVRNFVTGRRQHFAGDFASGAPLWEEPLDERPCLQDVGYFNAGFRTTWGYTIPSAPGDNDSLVLSGTVYEQEFRGVGRYNYMLAGGSDLPAFSDRATFRLIFTVPSSGIFVVQALVDPEELVPGAVISVEGHLVNAFLHLEGLTPVFIGALAEGALVLDAVEVSTEPGGVIRGSLEGKLTQFAPCPDCRISKQSQKCQDGVAKAGRIYALKRMRALQRCRNRLNRGIGLWEEGQALAVLDPAACEREVAAARAIRKAGGIARRVVSRRCHGGLLSELAACARSVDDLTSVEGSGGCLRDSHSELVDRMLADEYGLGLSADQRAERRCQQAVAKAGRVYLGARLKAEGECRRRFGRGFELFLDEAGSQSLESPLYCDEEAETAKTIARAGEKARRTIANPTSPACDDSLLATIVPCAVTVDGLVGPGGGGGCLIDGHARGSAALALQQCCHGMSCPY
ncbi:MAG: CotH kinase family protein, partial [Candidatus Binatia bacterium]